jgi:hypothetical protein
MVRCRTMKLAACIAVALLLVVVWFNVRARLDPNSPNVQHLSRLHHALANNAHELFAQLAKKCRSN